MPPFLCVLRLHLSSRKNFKTLAFFLHTFLYSTIPPGSCPEPGGQAMDFRPKEWAAIAARLWPFQQRWESRKSRQPKMWAYSPSCPAGREQSNSFSAPGAFQYSPQRLPGRRWWRPPKAPGGRCADGFLLPWSRGHRRWSGKASPGYSRCMGRLSAGQAASWGRWALLLPGLSELSCRRCFLPWPENPLPVRIGCPWQRRLPKKWG